MTVVPARAAPDSQPEGGPRRRRWLRRLVLAFGTLLLCVGVLEVVLRLAGYGPDRNRVQFLRHPDLQYVPAPDQDFMGGQDVPEEGRTRFAVHINNHGHRGEDHPLEKGDEYRIVVLGDSLVYGASVGNAEILTQVLQDGYAAEPTESGQSVLVANAANMGWATIHYLRWIETQADRFDPDLVVVGCFMGNDMGIPVMGQESIAVPLEGLLRKSAIGYFLYTTYRTEIARRNLANQVGRPVEDIADEDLLRFAGVLPDDMSFEEKRRLWQHSLPHFERMLELAEAKDIEVVVFLIPNAWMVERGDDAPIPRWLAAEIRRRGLRVISPISELAPLGREAWLSFDLGHFSPVGHRAAAAALRRGLAELDVLR